MRLAINLSLICLLAVGLVNSAPPKKERSPLVPKMKYCEHMCDGQSYSPVCAVDETGVTKTFDHKCAVELAICLKSGYYAVIRDGECL